MIDEEGVSFLEKHFEKHKLIALKDLLESKITLARVIFSITFPPQNDHARLQNLRFSEISNRQIKIFGKDEVTGSNPVISSIETDL
ncbi:MAG: hypothetical protein PUD16_14260 [bacterium]|nr:hypothetical protein [bacterium]